MVKLELELTDIDYEALINEYLPKMQEKLGPNSALSSLGGLAGSLFSLAGDSVKDKMAAEIINMNAARLEAKLEEVAVKNGIPGRVRNLKATAVNDR